MVKEYYKHQQRILDLNPERFLIAHDRGAGKTITALGLALNNKVRPLIVVPKPVRKKWHREMVGMGVDGRVMSREDFRKLATVENFSEYDALIIDEAHYGFPTLKAQLHKKAQWYIKKYNVKYVWLLTGSPYTSTAWSVYGLAQLLGYNWNYRQFQERFFEQRWIGRKVIWEPRNDVQDELAKLVRLIGDTIPLSACADVPEQTYEVETFEINAEQKRLNKQILENEPNPLVRTTKYHQVASGIMIGNEFTEDVTCDSAKNARIMEYAEENKKLVVFSRYNIHLDLLSAMLSKRGVPHAIINGEVDDKEVIIEQAEKSDRFVLLINAACSVGYELPSFDLVLFASLSYSFVDYSQACGRVLRINHLKKNVYIIMLTEGTVDDAVWSSIQNKQSFSEAIFSSSEITKYET
jgi:SNF2 family DNA or RNA helicase